MCYRQKRIKLIQRNSLLDTSERQFQFKTFSSKTCLPLSDRNLHSTTPEEACIGPIMDLPLYNTHVKLLAFDFLSLTQNLSPSNSNSSSDPISFSRNGTVLSRLETVGIVTSRELKPNKFLKFIVDDGTGCISCILWLNHLNSPYFSRRNPSDVRLIASAADRFASEVKLGVVARVRGRITSYRGALQITVSDVVVERDPNAEILHWLDCMRLARQCYNVVPSRINRM